jgi:biotin synthase
MEQDFPKKIRVSIGSAAILNLLTCKLDVSPTTVHLMTYYSSRCTANCSFCPQAKNSNSKSFLLSRISWPEFPTHKVVVNLKKAYLEQILRRVCIQAVNYPNVFTHLDSIVRLIKSISDIPISVSCQPQNNENIHQLANIGVDRIGIPIDAATKTLFKDVKGEKVDGPYEWENQFSKLITAVKIFGKGKVSTHLIVGLGESEKDVLSIVQTFFDLGILSALFAFTPIRGTQLEHRSQPSIKSYRRIQLAKYLIDYGLIRFEEMSFNDNNQLSDYGIKKLIINKIVETGNPFLTSGCPNCNRPFYNEKPSGPLYNFPRLLNPFEIAEIKQLIELEK